MDSAGLAFFVRHLEDTRFTKKIWKFGIQQPSKLRERDLAR